MRFEGSVSIAAPPVAVWRALTDTTTFGRITPGVVGIETIVPDERFTVFTGVTLGSQILALPIDVHWTERRHAERLTIAARSEVSGQVVAVHGHLDFSGEETTRIVFAADVPALPRSLPPALVHNVIGKTIRAFFMNLKQEVETAQPATPAGPRAPLAA